MEILLTFASIFILAFLVACLEMTFQLYMQPNMILYPYSVFLSWFTEKGEIYRHIARPLGRCRYCNGTWIMIYSFVYLTKYGILYTFELIPTLIFIALSVGLTAFFVMVLSNTVFRGVDPVTMTDKEREMIRYNKIIMNEKTLLPETVMVFTPWQAMMKSYVIIGSFYATVYIVVPYMLQLS